MDEGVRSFDEWLNKESPSGSAPKESELSFNLDPTKVRERLSGHGLRRGF